MLARILEVNVMDAEAHGHLLQTAGAVFFAGGAVAAVRGKHQLQYHAAVFEKARCVGADAHAVFRLGRAGGVDLAGVQILDHTHAARAVNGKVGVEAEVRHFHARLAADIHDRGLVVELHADVVDIHDTLSHRSPPPGLHQRGRPRCRYSI